MRVLLIDAGNTSSYHVMRSLAHHGHEIHLIGRSGTLWFLSKYCSKSILCTKQQHQKEQPFIEFLINIITQKKYNLLMCSGDTQAEFIYKNHELISKYIDCGIPDPNLQTIIFDKNAAYKHVQKIGIPVPEAHYPSNLDQVKKLKHKITYPVVVKGQKGSASSHVRFVGNAEDLLPYFQEVHDAELDIEGLPSIQEYIGGAGYLVHLLFYEGIPKAVCCHRKDREFPIGGGVTSAGTTVDIPELENSALKIGESLRWHGLMKLDFKYDPKTNQYKFIELDPRVSASIDITRASGTDQSVMLCDLLLGKQVDSILSSKPGVRYRWLFPRDLMYSIARPQEVLRIVPDLFSPNVFFDLSVSDWRPFFRSTIRFLRQLPGLISKGNIRRQAQHSTEIRKIFQLKSVNIDLS